MRTVQVNVFCLQLTHHWAFWHAFAEVLLHIRQTEKCTQNTIAEVDLDRHEYEPHTSVPSSKQQKISVGHSPWSSCDKAQHTARTERKASHWTAMQTHQATYRICRRLVVQVESLQLFCDFHECHHSSPLAERYRRRTGRKCLSLEKTIALSVQWVAFSQDSERPIDASTRASRRNEMF